MLGCNRSGQGTVNQFVESSGSSTHAKKSWAVALPLYVPFATRIILRMYMYSVMGVIANVSSDGVHDPVHPLPPNCLVANHAERKSLPLHGVCPGRIVSTAATLRAWTHPSESSRRNFSKHSCLVLQGRHSDPLSCSSAPVPPSRSCVDPISTDSQRPCCVDTRRQS